MYASFDRNSPATLSADVLSLSWKGDARRGWLATGNSKKTVGVTYTEICDEDEFDIDPSQPLEQYFDTEQVWALEKQAMRRNFNFREHSQEVTIVRWNHHLDKIATCDSSGTVIVWRNHSGRSIMELVNNRGVAISDFQWSNDGNKVLIAYIDGYVLVGTAYGRRIWARQLNLGSFVTSPNHSQSSKLLSSTWSPDDSRIVVGSSIGELIELDAIHGGTLVSTTEVLPGIGIIGLQWVMVPKSATAAADTKANASAGASDGNNRPQAIELGHAAFHNHIAAADAHNNNSSNNSSADSKSKGSVRLSLYLRNGKVVLMNSCGDQQATIIRTGLVDGKMLWSQDGSILTVAGFRKSQSMSTVRFFRPSGQLLFTLPLRTKEPVTAVTWGHSDRKFFVATKNMLHLVKVSREIPSLQSMCQALVAGTLPSRAESFDLVLPTKLKVAVAGCYDPLIQGHVPQNDNLLSYVCRPPPSSHRTYCIVIPNPNSRDNSNSSSTTGSTSSSSNQRYRHPTSYTLYVEHLGTIIPILEATKRNYKIRQAFTISLPSNSGTASSSLSMQKLVSDVAESGLVGDNSEGTVTTNSSQVRVVGHEAHLSLNTDLGVQVTCREDDTESPRHPISSASSGSASTATSVDASKLTGHNVEMSRHLAEVTSNVMASKFKIQGISDKVPTDMGSIMIKTSFLHIQPRKVIAYLPYPETSPDSGIDTDSSSDESMEEGNGSTEVDGSCSADVFMEPESHSIESLMSMEELQLPKTAEPETQASSLMETTSEPSRTSKSQNSSSSATAAGSNGYSCTSTNVKGQRVSVSESHIQIHSKTPTWNEQHMIYQLDFGGRVTTKSAKNFQLEMDNEQVLQFGRIDNGCFILDFQAPFSPIQAFATALANLV